MPILDFDLNDLLKYDPLEEDLDIKDDLSVEEIEGPLVNDSKS